MSIEESGRLIPPRRLLLIVVLTLIILNHLVRFAASSSNYSGFSLQSLGVAFMSEPIHSLDRVRLGMGEKLSTVCRHGPSSAEDACGKVVYGMRVIFGLH